MSILENNLVTVGEYKVPKLYPSSDFQAESVGQSFKMHPVTQEATSSDKSRSTSRSAVCISTSKALDGIFSESAFCHRANPNVRPLNPSCSKQGTFKKEKGLCKPTPEQTPMSIINSPQPFIAAPNMDHHGCAYPQPLCWPSNLITNDHMADPISSCLSGVSAIVGPHSENCPHRYHLLSQYGQAVYLSRSPIQLSRKSTTNDESASQTLHKWYLRRSSTEEAQDVVIHRLWETSLTEWKIILVSFVVHKKSQNRSHRVKTSEIDRPVLVFTSQMLGQGTA
ncbi:hypothetical protein BJ742DRAFT_734896 [Cladochytrium replicatum]|nr:hypothetical protein BJ742DRAFT_734896 [Cladochytrium replicatum]